MQRLFHILKCIPYHMNDGFNQHVVILDRLLRYDDIY